MPFFFSLEITEFATEQNKKHLKYKLLINIVNAIVHRVQRQTLTHHPHTQYSISYLYSCLLEIDDWNDNMKLSLFFFFVCRWTAEKWYIKAIQFTVFFPVQRLQAFSHIRYTLHPHHVFGTIWNGDNVNESKTCFSCLSLSSKWWRWDKNTTW